MIHKMIFIILTLLFLPICFGVKLNTPRILLPFNFQNNPVSYILEVTETINECFSWSSLQEDIVSIKPLVDNDCSHAAMVTAISKQSSTHKVIVLAEDPDSGVVLRCDVIVDAPVSLSIATTTREIYVEEAAEEFELVAYDAAGNQFSSLDGVAFDWGVVSPSGQPVIKIHAFLHSNYETSEAIRALETRGLRGDKVLLVGVSTGIAHVTASVKHPSFKELAADPVTITSVANLLLLPPDVYVLSGTTVPYTVAQVKHGRLHNIDLVTSPYFLSVKDTGIASLGSSKNSVDAVSKGSTEVVLRDVNMGDSETGAAARLYVVQPARISLSAPPHNDWVVVAGGRVRLQCHLWDASGNKIWLGDNISIDLTIDSDYFSTDFTVANGSYIEGVPTKPGRATVKAFMDGYTLLDGSVFRLSSPLSTSSTLEIYQPLHIVPERVLLPWNPVTKPTYQIQLNHTGGDGLVTWSFSSSQLASVSQLGMLRTRDQGHGQVTVSLQRNPRVSATAQIFVVPVTGISVLPGVRESEVGRTLSLPISLYGLMPDGRPANFTRCPHGALSVAAANQRFSVRLSGGEQDGQADESTALPDGACCRVLVTGSDPGHTRITARIQPTWLAATRPTPSSAASPAVAPETSCLVGLYQPLQVSLDLVEGLLMAPGSSWQLQLVGGPLPWPTNARQHFTRADSSAVDRVSVRPSGSGDGFSAHLLCLSVGESDLHVSVGNPVHSPDLLSPAVASVRLPVRCSLPDRIQLSIPTAATATDAVRRQLPPCPAHSPVRAHAGQPLLVRAVCEDSGGRRFHNVSSLRFAWTESSGGQLASLRSRQESPVTSLIDAATVKELVPAGVEGTLTVQVTLGGSLISGPQLQAQLPVKLVKPLLASPGELVVFNHPSNRESIALRHGSGYVAVRPHPSSSSDADRLAVWQHQSGNYTVTVAPLAVGSLTLHIWDLCLLSTPPVAVSVEVSGVVGVELSVASRLAVGSRTQARVAALGTGGHRLPGRLSSLLALRLETLTPDIVSLRYLSEEGDMVVYEVHADGVGDAVLVTRAGPPTAGAETSRQLEVFPPLQLTPRNSTLPVGGQLQLVTAGGPRGDTSLRYASALSDTVAVSADGLVSARQIGVSRITASVSGSADGDTVYSQDSVSVSVVELCGVSLRAPLSRIQRGEQQPLYADGLDQQGRSFIIAVPLLSSVRLVWSSSSPQTAAVTSPLQQLGVVSDEGVSMRLTALEAGSTQVSVALAFNSGSAPTGCPARLAKKSLLHLTVYEELRLTSPPVAASGSLLMSPSSSLLLTSSPAWTTATSTGSGRISPLVRVSGRRLEADSRLGTEVLLLNTAAAGHSSAALRHQHQDSPAVVATNQTLALLVEVLPVHYVMMTLLPDFRVSAAADALPAGVQVRVKVSAHDARGRALHSWRLNHRLAAGVSRADLLQLVGGAEDVVAAPLVVSLRQPGNAALSLRTLAPDTESPVTSSSSQVLLLHDVLFLPTAPLLTNEQSELTVGEVMCLGSPLLAADSLASSTRPPPRWTSHSPDVLAVTIEGRAIARHPGTAAVSLSLLPSDLQARANIRVLPIMRLLIEPPNSISGALVSPCSADGYSLPVQLSARPRQLQSPGCTPPSSQLLPPPFRCRLQLVDDSSIIGPTAEQLFNVDTVFNHETGSFECRLQGVSCRSGLQLSTASAELLLTAATSTSSSPPVHLQLLPGVHHEPARLQLADDASAAELTLIGLPGALRGVTVAVDHRSLQISEPEYVTLGRVRFSVLLLGSSTAGSTNNGPVTAAGDHTLTASVTVTLPATGQIIHVPVHVIRVDDAATCRVPAPRDAQLSWQQLWREAVAGGGWLWTVLGAATLVYWLLRTGRVRVTAGGDSSAAASPRLIGPPPPYSKTSPQDSPVSPVHLWTDDTQPVYGSPLLARRSPYADLSSTMYTS